MNRYVKVKGHDNWFLVLNAMGSWRHIRISPDFQRSICGEIFMGFGYSSLRIFLRRVESENGWHPVAFSSRRFSNSSPQPLLITAISAWALSWLIRGTRDWVAIGLVDMKSSLLVWSLKCRMYFHEVRKTWKSISIYQEDWEISYFNGRTCTN